MRAVAARVSRASVTVVRDDGARDVVGAIGEGLLVLLDVHRDDVGDPDRADTMARKLHELRLLRGLDGGPERSCADAGAPLLVVSQFTLHGDTRRGRRPSWSAAAPPRDAEPIVEDVVDRLRARGATVGTGEFGATMEVESINDGPFTVLVET